MIRFWCLRKGNGQGFPKNLKLDEKTKNLGQIDTLKN